MPQRCMFRFMADEVLNAIGEILREEHKIPPRKLLPTARLAEDLGIDGDDAVALFERLSDRFGTDFSALFERWIHHFRREGISPREFLIGVPLVLIAGAASAAFYLWLGLPSAWWTVVLTFATTAALLLPVRRRLTARPSEPVTVADLAAAVRSGAWPRPSRAS